MGASFFPGLAMVKHSDPQHPVFEETGNLVAEDYPELSLRVPVEGPARLAASAGPELVNLHELVRDGTMRGLEGARIGSLFTFLLEAGPPELLDLAVERVLKALASTAPEDRRWGLEGVRQLAAPERLARIPGATRPHILDEMIRLLAREERTELRDSALGLLGALLGFEASQGGLEQAGQCLSRLEHLAAGRGRDYRLRIESSRELVVPVLEHLFQEGEAVLECVVLPFLEFAGETGARTLVALLEDEQDRHRRARILGLLKRLGPVAVPALQEGLVAGSWHLVRNALNLVGELEEARTFEYVVPCLDHGDERVIQAAIRALWKTGGERAEAYLLELLPRVQPLLQLEALQGLERIGSQTAVPVLATLAGSGAEAVRVKALELLGRIRDPGATPLLEALLRRKGLIIKRSEPLPVRVAAARALVALGTPEARRIVDQVVVEEPKGPSKEALRAVG